MTTRLANVPTEPEAFFPLGEPAQGPRRASLEPVRPPACAVQDRVNLDHIAADRVESTMYGVPEITSSRVSTTRPARPSSGKSGEA
jgi:hypothetical protein